MCRHRRRKCRLLEDVITALSQLHRKVDHLMTQQDDINAIVARLETIATGIRADIDTLKADHPDLDLSALEAKVAALEAIDAENPAAPGTPEEPTEGGTETASARASKTSSRETRGH